MTMQRQPNEAIDYLAVQYEQVKEAMRQYPDAAEKICMDVEFADNTLTVYAFWSIIDKKRLYLQRHLLDCATNRPYSANQFGAIVWVYINLLKYVDEMNFTGLQQHLEQFYSKKYVSLISVYKLEYQKKRLAMRALPLPISNEICEYLF